jgi:protein-disulfide isomerase
MRPLPLVILLRLSLLVAIAASAALIVEYQNAGDPAFCGVGSGCFAVRISPYSRLFGIPLPYIGLIAHAGLFAGSLLVRRREHLRQLALVASAGAACAIILILIQQFAVGAFCSFCLAVDISSILAAACAVTLAAADNKRAQAEAAADAAARAKAGETNPAARPPDDVPDLSDPLWRAVTTHGTEALVWAAAAALGIALPFVWGRYPVLPPLPPGIAALQTPDRVTIIGFTDFQCPFCRKLHPEMHALEQKHAGRIHYERRMMPLQSHPGALPAAQAYLCAPEAQREAAANWLYEAPDDQLTSIGVLAMGEAIGIDKTALTRCVASKETQDAISRDKALYDEIGARGLPLTYIGQRVVLGFDPDRIERAIQSELHGERTSLKLSWLFIVLGAVFATATTYTWLRKGRGTHPALPDSPDERERLA